MINANRIKIYDVKVSMIKKDQFKLDTGCDKYNQCELISHNSIKNIDKKSDSKNKKSIKNCKNYKLRKDPKCNDQEGCEWVVNKGCLNK